MRAAEPDASVAESIVERYLSGTSIRRISGELGLSRRLVRAMLRDHGVRVEPVGRGRPRPEQRICLPPGMAERLSELYLDRRLTRREIAELVGVSDQRIRLWLREAGIPSRTRGRLNREDRHRPARADLEDLYVERELPGEAVAVKLASGRRGVFSGLHEQGLPVRVANRPQASVVVLDKLYGDRLVRRTLARHGVPLVRRPGPLHERFPEPVALTPALLKELYVDCGLALVHIELATGHPADTVKRRLTSIGVPLRPQGGLSPFMRRVRGLKEGARRGDQGS